MELNWDELREMLLSPNDDDVAFASGIIINNPPEFYQTRRELLKTIMTDRFMKLWKPTYMTNSIFHPLKPLCGEYNILYGDIWAEYDKRKQQNNY